MTGRDEVWTACPNCDAEIPFFATVDGENASGDEKRCPECGTDVDALFDMAIAEPIEPAEPQPELEAIAGGESV